MAAVIKAIDYYLPENICTNDELAKIHPQWPMDKIVSKIGITSRRYASDDEFSIELGIKAAKQLLNHHDIDPDCIDFILFCTQTPKFLSPTNACVIQEALGLSQQVGALDINQGCSGYVYSLMLAESLVMQRRAINVLLITADTYTRYVDKNDHCLLPIFGEGASASLITYEEGEHGIQGFEYGTNGAEAEKIIAANTGIKGLTSGQAYKPDLFMNGPAVFNFALEVVPKLVKKLLDNVQLKQENIDHFIFHQANAYMLEHIRERMNIPEERFIVNVREIGNTTSSSIPIALHGALKEKRIKKGDKVIFVAFGVGLSWAACLVQM